MGLQKHTHEMTWRCVAISGWMLCSGQHATTKGEIYSSKVIFHPDCFHFMLPKRKFWKAESTFQNVFWKHFSTILSPNLVLTPLKKTSKTHSETLVRPSQTFVWEGYISKDSKSVVACHSGALFFCKIVARPPSANI